MMDAEGRDPYSNCKKEVLDTEQTLFCDLCKWWEHLDCIKANDKPSQQCYNALTGVTQSCSYAHAVGARVQ